MGFRPIDRRPDQSEINSIFWPVPISLALAFQATQLGPVSISKQTRFHSIGKATGGGRGSREFLMAPMLEKKRNRRLIDGVASALPSHLMEIEKQIHQ